MKALLVTIALIVSATAHADDAKYYANGKEVTKVEALKTLFVTPSVTVTACKDQELTKKGTLRNK